MDFLTLIFSFAPILAASDDSGAAAAPLVLLLSGFIFYGIMYSRYRNADKRHSHESETSTMIANLVPSDVFIEKKKGLKSASMNGANHTRIEGALNQGSSSTKLLGG